MERIGFFGGCFNPPTIAHIELIEKAIISDTATILDVLPQVQIETIF